MNCYYSFKSCISVLQSISKLNVLKLPKPLLHHNLRYSQVYAGENNVKSIFEFWKNKFRENAISEPKESIEHILTFNLGSTKISDMYKNMNYRLNADQMEIVQKMCDLRLKRMPVQYIIGEWDFRDLTLKMRPPVFIPRPETESLVDIIIDDLNTNTKINILELCCGSGAISLALLKSIPEARIIAVDQSLEACQLTRENAGIHQLEDRLAVINSTISNENRLGFLENNVDIMVSNPPYVPRNDMETLEPEIYLYEDLKALDGGSDGLNLIKIILSIASEKLKPEGKLYLETDVTHPELIRNYIKMNSDLGLSYIQTYKDFCKKDRFIKIEKK